MCSHRAHNLFTMYLFSVFSILSSLTSISLGAPLGGMIVGRDTVLLTSYDFIIVGGGTSGLVVGNRLTENPGWNLLNMAVLIDAYCC